VKRFIASVFVCSFALFAQQSNSQGSTVDVNGRRVSFGPDVVRSKSDGTTDVTERVQSINGRTVPLEKVEERVVRDDANGKLIERTIRRFSPTGDPAPPVRETIEEQKHSDGSVTTQTATYRGDINGGMQLVSRSITEVHKSGSTESADTVIQRPTLNGSLDTVERQSTVTVKESNGGYRTDSSTYRRNANGNMVESVRQATMHTEQGNNATDQTAEYEIGPDGKLQLHQQTVAQIVTGSDGSKQTQVDVYGMNVPGTVDPGSKLRLQEQRLIGQRKSGDTVVETLSVRRASVADPNSLGPAQQVSETVCRGKCTPDKDKP